jgi:long-chain acyl-CoA synthetase
MTAVNSTNVALRFLATAKARGAHTAVVDDTGSADYQTLAGMALKLAGIFATVPGTQIGILLPSNRLFVAAYYGALLANKTVVPLNFLLPPDDLMHCFKDAEVRTVVTADFFKPKLEGKGLDIHTVETLVPKLMDPATPLHPVNPAALTNPLAQILYTSGTSARPKGVETTHVALNHNIDASVDAMNVTAEAKMIGVIPLFHTFGITVTTLVPTIVGGTVYQQKQFQPKTTLDQIVQHGATHMLGVPTMYGYLVKIAKKAGIKAPTLTCAVSGGEPLHPELAKQFEEHFGLALSEGYGMTEHSPTISVCRLGNNKIGTVGQPLPGVEIRITEETEDIANAKRLPDGESGEIWIRSPSVMRGYRNLADDTAKTIVSHNVDGAGWLRSGDIGMFDADGYLKITGRAKDLIISGGENMFPVEIEQALMSHPAVEVAAVIGVPDVARGEVPYAFIQLREGQTATTDEIREHALKLIAPYKVPRQYRFEKSLPLTPTGKVFKRALPRPEAK